MNKGISITSRLAIFTSFTLLANLACQSAFSDPAFPEPGYIKYEVPLIWQNLDKKGTPTKTFQFKENKKSADELNREETFAIELPAAPKSGKLYIRLSVSGLIDPEAKNNPIIQIYGATFAYANESTPNDDTTEFDRKSYAFTEVSNDQDSNWSLGRSEPYKIRTRPGEELNERTKQRMLERAQSRYLASIEIDFDSQTWSFYPNRDDKSYPLLPEKGAHFLIFRKNTANNSYISDIVFSESFGSSLNRSNNKDFTNPEESDVEAQERIDSIADEIRRRRVERKEQLENKK